MDSFLASPLGSSLQSFLPAGTWLLILATVGVLGMVFVITLFLKKMGDSQGKPKRFIKQLISERKFQEAGDLYLAQGDLAKALALFVQGKVYSKAARVCEMRGEFEQAGEFYEQARSLPEAVDAFREAKKFERAGKLLLQQGQKSEAGRLFEETGLLTLAASAYHENGQFLDAAKIYLRLESFEKAGDMYALELTQQVRAIRGQVTPSQWDFICKMASEGAQAYLKAGIKEKAADLYLKGEKYREAANVFQSLGQLDQAAESLKKGKLFEEAAQLFEKANRTQEMHQMLGEFYRQKKMTLEAADHFTRAEDFQNAAELWVQLGENEKAAECLEKVGDYVEASSHYVHVGKHEKAAQCLEKAGALEGAATHYAKSGNVSKRTQLLLKAGKFFECGQLFLQEGSTDRAIQVFQEIPAESPDFTKAASFLGRIFFEKGMFGVSLKKFEQAVAGQTVKASNLEDYYHMGVIQERTGEFKNAARIYEQILATHYNYADVASRLGNVQLEMSKRRVDGSTGSLPGPSILSQTGDSPATSGATKTRPERFELVEELGRGGMGIVYKARDRILSRIVALKYLPSNFARNAVAVKNFRREAQSSARLNHPGIVTVYDVGYDSRGNYIAMEYLEGRTIKDYIRDKGALELDIILSLLGQMAQALDYAHQNKVIHRDIKTSNMLWCENGVVKIMDFGLAKFMQEARNHMTQISGTPYYMSPEQTMGGEIDQRTDIYSLGVSLFEMVTGEVPFRDGDIGYQHVHAPLPDPRQKRPDVTPILRDIILKCMQKKPEDRFQSTIEIGARLKEMQDRVSLVS